MKVSAKDLIELASPGVPKGRDGENAPESGRFAQKMALTASQRGKNIVFLQKPGDLMYRGGQRRVQEQSCRSRVMRSSRCARPCTPLAWCFLLRLRIRLRSEFGS